MRKDERMIPAEEAGKIIGEFKGNPVVEEMDISDSFGRVLAEDIFSEMDMPPFDKSAMDGYAVSSSDRSDRFRIVETIAAGGFPEKSIGPGECAKIMTGAPLPKGADRVIKVEVTGEENGYMFLTGEDRVLNVCLRGEDIKKGDLILKCGTAMRAQETGIAASMGKRYLKVYKRLVTGVVSTGSEIREPGDVLSPGHIYNSNAYSLSAQIKNAGGMVKFRMNVPDDKQKLRESFERVLGSVDLMIISGGVSMGQYDYVPEILEELGVTVHFNKVAVQPGKPTLFGTRGDKAVFGLPGNPVSTFVIFEIFVRPLLLQMSGAVWSPVILTGRLESGFVRRKTERDLYIPVYYDRGKVKMIDYHGSAHFNSLTGANGLLKIARGVERIPAGEMVDVRQI